MISDILRLGPGTLGGRVDVPPSKSLLHRAMICAALAGRPGAVAVPVGASEDIQATRRVLAALAAARGGSATVSADCGESGTTLRLLVPVAAALGVDAVFTGSGRLPRRPMGPYADAFADSGAVLEFPDSGTEFLPLRVSGRLRSGRYVLPGDVSSQFVSGLLLALPLLEGDSEVRLGSQLQSRPYVDMTIAVMRDFGVAVEESATGFRVAGGARYRVPPSGSYAVEGDASQEAFWHLANHLGSAVQLASPASSGLQGDAAYPALVSRLRSASPTGSRPEIDVSQVPDLVPALAAAAAFTPCGVRLVRGERLRLKESDRIATTCALLRAFGVSAEETADGIVVSPGQAPSRPGLVVADAAGDHRIAMTAAMLATVRPCELHGAASVAKSWPSFFEDYKAAGGRVEAVLP